jgi:hypothetical protein
VTAFGCCIAELSGPPQAGGTHPLQQRELAVVGGADGCTLAKAPALSLPAALHIPKRQNWVFFLGGALLILFPLHLLPCISPLLPPQQLLPPPLPLNKSCCSPGATGQRQGDVLLDSWHE